VLAAKRRNTEIDLNFDPKELSRAKVMAFHMQQYNKTKVFLKFENHFFEGNSDFYTSLHGRF
jgi:hypothetical protein